MYMDDYFQQLYNKAEGIIYTVIIMQIYTKYLNQVVDNKHLVNI